ELNKALEGREDSATSVLEQVRLFMGQLDENKDDIVTAIDSLNNLAVSVNGQMDSIDAALDELPSALTSLDQQRADLVKMLTALDRHGRVRRRQRTSDGSADRAADGAADRPRPHGGPRPGRPLHRQRGRHEQRMQAAPRHGPGPGQAQRGLPEDEEREDRRLPDRQPDP